MTDDTPKPELTPANQNPWYILMTLHGEQPEGATGWNYDEELHAQNRRDWNRWAARGLSPERRAVLLAAQQQDEAQCFLEEDLTPHSAEERAELVERFSNACAGRRASVDFPWFHLSYDLSNVEFPRTFLAEGFLFLDYINFSGAIFARSAVFNQAIFSRAPNFHGAIFSGEASFQGTTFSGFINLQNAAFLDNAWFNRAIFSGATYFSGTKFSHAHRADFSGVRFDDLVSFHNAELMGDTSFAGVVFERRPPRFHGAKLNDGVAFHEVVWPKPPQSNEQLAGARLEISAIRAIAQWDVYNYQRLKQIMEGLKKHEDELNFFAMEMAAQRVVDGGWGSLRGALNGLYGAVSDYGRSILRPTLAFFPFFALSAPIFEQSARVGEGCAPLTGAQAAGVSLATFLSVLPGLKDTINYKCLSTLATFTAGFNAVVGAVLLFLIGLGLRNRFRMK